MRRSRFPVLFSMMLLVALAGCSLAPKKADTQEEGQCAGLGFHQFDFWLGQWAVVQNPDEPVKAYNRISSILQGCAIQENYFTESGYTGRSLSWFDTETRQWHQTWVDSNGLILQLRGGLDERGHMVMFGRPRLQQGQKVIDRLTWMPQPDGQVQQIWDVSTDGGKQWNRVFSGLYFRRAIPRLQPPKANKGIDLKLSM